MPPWRALPWALVLTLVAASPAQTEEKVPASETAPPGRALAAPFVDDRRCAECHQREYQQWSGSHHDWAMKPATADTVLGDFKDTRFTHFGVTSRFFMREDRYFVNTEGADGKLADFEIKYTFGVEPLQQYLIEFPGGRLQGLTVAWDSRPNTQGGQRWFHLYPDERIPADDPLHWTGLHQNWNGRCAECHSTNLDKGYDPEAQTYRTTWSAINVTCQACHGPGEAHLQWAENRQQGQETDAEDGKGLVVDFRNGDSRYQVDACARCHARRQWVSSGYRHGRPLLDDFRPVALRTDLYHADGQILDEVYVYGSFLQSKMYRAGVGCTDCHNPHTLKLKAPGNAVCTQCHQTKLDPRFPSLRAMHYDAPDHHFHLQDSEGARCVNCHMSARTYMVVDPRRDHSFRIPRPDLSVKISTPNACTDCHPDQSAQWAAEAVARWYGPERRREPHYGEILAAGRTGESKAGARLAELAADPAQPTIVRATALELLRGYGREGIGTLLKALSDPDPLLRVAAVGGLQPLPPEQRLKVLGSLLGDPIRAVRTEATRVLASVPAQHFQTHQRQAFESAIEEYRQAQLAIADMPASRLNLAVLQTLEGQPEKAVESYRTAIRMDPFFLPARVNLANLYNALGRNQEAEHELREAIERAPDEGELRYSLGLLLAEEKRLGEAAEALGEAARRLPKRARVHYNHGLALQQLGRRGDAERALLRAERLDRNDPDTLQALVILYAQQQQWDSAYPYAERLVRLYPNAPGPRRMLEQIQVMKQYRAAPQ